MNDVNSFNISINNIEEMITYFKEKNPNTKKKYKGIGTLTSLIKSVDIVGATTTSVTLSFTGVGLLVVPISAENASALSLGNKLKHKIIINKKNKYQKQCQKDQQTIKSFDNFSRKSLQDNLIERNKYCSLSNIFD